MIQEPGHLRHQFRDALPLGVVPAGSVDRNPLPVPTHQLPARLSEDAPAQVPQGNVNHTNGVDVVTLRHRFPVVPVHPFPQGIGAQGILTDDQ
ncbi:MAG: hypothetical protein EB039_15635 [Proteobacteria bacterium]|nr:hypothetical protein [Pseudomonadota bacterium]